MADVNQTLGGVQPSDEAGSGNLKVVVHQESGRSGKSKLVFDAHRSQQQCASPEEDNINGASPYMVRDVPKDSKTAHLNSDSKGTHLNRDSHTYFSSLIFYLVFFKFNFKKFNFKKFLFYSLLFLPVFFSYVRGEKNCDKVLTADDVEKDASNNLNFHNGGYKEIKDDAFANATAAGHLDISSNCLQTVAENAFDNLTNAHSINMGDNEFTCYPLALRRPDTLNKMRALKFEKNRISYLGEDVFKGKHALEHISFAQNQLEIIHNKALEPLFALITANFSINKLTFPPLLNLTRLSYLRQIDLRNCLLKTLGIGYYSSLPEVTSINITDEIMAVSMGAERVVMFLIGGNSETISCEENEQDILRSNVVINYNISCKDRNGNRLVLTGTNKVMSDVIGESTPMSSVIGESTPMSDVIVESTLMSNVIGESTPMSSVIGESTTLYANLQRALIHAIKSRNVFLALCVVLFSVVLFIVVLIIFLCWKGNLCQRSILKLWVGQKRSRQDPESAHCEENGLKMELKA
ncbi:Leucine-rich repeat-containing G-protein coupled receptor 6 [Holothuria leucospilota]|uniref:Leucine-rich repeat-containing G-protein coupled receptor 6 n=1 Tax=Holothuria leucospilota TaxID=206669 RepID=A0A9Q1H0R7_HOLLE|nr:Leucine-rich repeat-containing G-protein coupled receptor 6 [Holothuria leucospilota]